MRYGLLLFLLAMSICVAAPARGQTFRYEAENGTLNQTVIQSSLTGYSGTGYVSFATPTAQSFTIQVPASIPDGMYEVVLGYNTANNGHKEYNFTIGSESGSGGFDSTANMYAEDIAGVFQFTGAKNIQIQRNWGYYYVDYVELRPANLAPPAPVAPVLNNPSADANTQVLMNYLSTIYGNKTLAGQQVSTGGSAVPFPSQTYQNKSGGLTPALYASDLIDYSYTRNVAHNAPGNANPNFETERVRDWAKATGGVVTMMWHWNAPDDLVNTPCGQSCGPNDYPWWRGFYAAGSNFNLPAALANPGGEKYQKILRDIDEIAVELQKFEDAGVPVLWRPLHEVTTGGFWWGEFDPASYRQLWQLMHDRLTDYHGLDNLIWVYTTSMWKENLDPAKWYPGDDYVDIVGVDIYTNSTSSISGPWHELLDQLDGEKMIALTETGHFPNAQSMRDTGTNWLWFTPWNDVPNNISSGALQTLLGDDDIVTLDELPVMPWKTGGSFLSADFDFDGDVDADDLAAWEAAYAQSRGGDADFNGTTDGLDFLALQRQYTGPGTLSANSVTVPEPAVFGLLGVASMIVIGRRRDRYCLP